MMTTTDRDFRVLLWDIDGTLIRSTQSGNFKHYFTPALEAVFGRAGRLAEMTVSGMTDLQIAAEALHHEGIRHEHIRERVGEFRTRFMVEMERVTTAAAARGEPFFYALPGAREILEAVDQHPRYCSALLTGNLEPAAHLKMELVGLSHFFRLPGAFGDDSHDRRDLPALAAQRIEQHLRIKLDPAQFIVLGDTPNDIACARHFGARAVAVATGRGYTADDLRPHHPDVILPGLADTTAVLRTLDEL
ncbi:MAG: haloacid dehalogenase-like hydrolase [Acidobacteriota bacterium]|nr:haloacid dehalogenase-like hydrolase [Acidobacteriota bacterium]